MSRYTYSGNSDYTKYTPKTHPWRGKTFIGYSPGIYRLNGKPYCPNSWIMHLSDDVAKGLTVMNKREELEALVTSYGAKLEWHGAHSPAGDRIAELESEVRRLRKMGQTKRKPICGLGGALQRLREARSIGLQELARRSGVSAGIISRLETITDANPEWHTVCNLARGLNMTVAAFASEVTAWGRFCAAEPAPVKTTNLDDAEDNKAEFIKRLMKAGWTRKHATAEWESIQEEKEGQL